MVCLLRPKGLWQGLACHMPPLMNQIKSMGPLVCCHATSPCPLQRQDSHSLGIYIYTNLQKLEMGIFVSLIVCAADKRPRPAEIF